MTKKLIALVLALLMVVPMIASCKDETKADETTGKSTESNAGEGSALGDDPLIPEIDAHLEELAEVHNFKDETFTWIGPNGWQAPTDEKDTGDIQSDALYHRQRDIEELFGVDWENYIPEGVDEESSPTVEAVKQDVLAGTGAYDAGYSMATQAQMLLVNDTLVDTSEFTTVDLEREWWQQDLDEMYSIGGALYFLTGPIVTAYYQDAYSVLFNKQVAEDYGIEDLYSIVKDGDWTFDKMFEVASKVPDNANGSGAYRYGDADGIATIIAHDMTITKFDEDGNPYIEDSVSTELSNIADKFSDVFGDDTQTANTKSSKEEDIEEKYGYENYAEMFADDKILFLFIPTDEAAWLRTREVEFGILPMPKGSDSQENYVSYATRRSVFTVFVPKSAKNMVMTDVILEAMAALGYKYFKPVYYENMLKSRSTFDYDSKDMIDIIFETKRYDLIDMLDVGGSVNGAGAIVSLLSRSVEESSDSLVSDYIMQSIIVNMNITDLIASVEADR